MMSRIRLPLFALALAAVAASAKSALADPAEIPAELCGRWILVYYVPPGGEATPGDGKQFFTLSASKVKVEKALDFLANDELAVAKVVPHQGPPGKTTVLVTFTNGANWLVGQRPKSEKDILIMLVDSDGSNGQALKVKYMLRLSPAQ